MEALETRLPGVIVLQPRIHGDARGWFQETYRENELARLGVTDRFVQDNHSRSARGVLRGMHFQVTEPQAKLVRCARGSILDVVVDIRRGSPTFGQWEAWELDDESGLQLYCPVGFAHGFVVLSDVADVVYRCSAYYDAEGDSAIAWDDPDLGIQWPGIEVSVSDRDRAAPRLSEVATSLPFTWTG
jgi:dTDP-4-dehydrorhamnose 3,5-epimerase